MRKYGIIEGLAKNVEVQCRVAEVREGRGDRPDAQRSGGFPEHRGPSRFLAMGVAHLYDLLQAFLLCLPGFIVHAGCAPNLFPPFQN